MDVYRLLVVIFVLLTVMMVGMMSGFSSSSASVNSKKDSIPSVFLFDTAGMHDLSTATREDCMRFSALLTERVSALQQQIAGLRKLRMAYGKLYCENNMIGPTGGFCLYQTSSVGGNGICDTAMCTVMANIFAGKSLLDLGCGLGQYKQCLVGAGKGVNWTGLDGAEGIEEATNGTVTFADLTIPIVMEKKYDYVMSLEVAEHIPKEYEDIFLDNILRHAREGVLLSWSLPEQTFGPGHGHVNLQPNSYVIEKMRKRGFDYDDITTMKLREAATVGWFKVTVMMFMRRMPFTSGNNMKDSNRRKLHSTNGMHDLSTAPGGHCTHNGRHHITMLLENVSALQQQVAGLRKLRMAYGKLYCENNMIGPTGGFCLYQASRVGGNDVCDTAMCTVMTDIFAGKSLLDLGCGLGQYKQCLVGAGKGVDWTGLDGAEGIEEATNGAVIFSDLTIPIVLGKKYDFVMSLEVAEHIPKEYEDIFLDNILRHAREGVLLSWSLPEQTFGPGHGHVNLQPNSYVIEKMNKRGFDYDNTTTVKLREAATVGWLKVTVMMFRRSPQPTHA